MCKTMYLFMFFLVCEICEHEFNPGNDSKKFRANEEEEEDDDDQDYGNYDDDEVYETPMLQNKDQKRKVVEAVEKPMDDKELKSYFNQYISVLKEQRQQTKTFSDKQLHKIIVQLFQSLQYKSEKPEGELLNIEEIN
jgi:hypothetical protein